MSEEQFEYEMMQSIRCPVGLENKIRSAVSTPGWPPNAKLSGWTGIGEVCFTVRFRCTPTAAKATRARLRHLILQRAEEAGGWHPNSSRSTPA